MTSVTYFFVLIAVYKPLNVNILFSRTVFKPSNIKDLETIQTFQDIYLITKFFIISNGIHYKHLLQKFK